MKKHTLLIFSSVFVIIHIYGFPLVPRNTNYSVHNYNAGNQNWSVTQDKEGRVYFGNNQGVLEYDGMHWKLYQLPNNDIVRCVYYSNDRRLYVGSYEEFGYFVRDEFNQLKYTSLKDLLEDYVFKNDEIWNIIEYNDRVYFQYFSSYFVYDGSTLKAYKEFPPLNMFIYKDKIFSQKINGNLFIYENDTFENIIDRKLYGDDDLIGILPNNENSLLITCNKGIYLLNHSDSTVNVWHNSINEELKTSSVNKVIMAKDSYIIGTLSNGVYALDKNGNLLWKLNSENGLMNNTVLALFCDEDNNLWLGLDNGLVKIYHNSDLYIFNPTPYHIGMVYDALISDEVSYIASNQGLYYYQNKVNKLKMLPGTEGQTWSISNIDGQVICGHNMGSFRVEGEKVIPFSSIKGARNIIKCTINNQDILFQNTYTFLNVYRKKLNGEWYYSNRIENFMNLIEHIEVDHLGNIWAEHMHRGIFRIKLNDSLTEAEDVKFYNTLGESKDLKINVFKVNGRIVFTGENKFYTYDDIIKEIIPYDKLNDELTSLANTYNVVQKSNSEYWFIDRENYSLVQFSNDRYIIKHQIPLLIFDNPPIDNKGNVFIVSGKDTYFALNGALAKYMEDIPATNSRQPELKIKEIKVYDNNGLNIILLSVNTKGEINYSNNNIHISLYCPVFSERSVYIRYRLDGLDETGIWHENMKDLQTGYSRLPFGEYIFRAELFNSQEIISEVKYSFIIKIPYYLAYYAIILYIVIGIGLIFFIIYSVYNYTNRQKNKQRNQQIQEQKRLHDAEIEHQQKLIIELEKEQLALELSHKSKELANFTMLSIRNKEFLIHIKEELVRQSEKGQFSKHFIGKIIHSLDDNMTSDDDWAMFQSNFDRIHENFFRNLKERYPDLTSNDLRLCALLRLNLSTKDISNMMNISIRGIEAARYRLRKRLNIPSEQDLTDFMIRFK
ncbi:hypothetical protein EZS27_000325 [termite gut metagenome]|uniref:HTH luxR-type domain-containing protein n=1 Tax=termite gut metagenome TaxID=433724 RepID=A0A5J4T4S4_9ZZZZ